LTGRPAETSLEGIEHLSKEKKENKERKMKEKNLLETIKLWIQESPGRGNEIEN